MVAGLIVEKEFDYISAPTGLRALGGHPQGGHGSGQNQVV